MEMLYPTEKVREKSRVCHNPHFDIVLIGKVGIKTSPGKNTAVLVGGVNYFYLFFKVVHVYLRVYKDNLVDFNFISLQLVL